jgi:diaminopimelate epimerase
MKLTFHKYQGTGNDFIIIDNRSGVFDANRRDLIKKLCDRRFGIGADGLMLLENTPGFDFKMVYFNSDGNESTMCGNGGRCLVKFAYNLDVFTHNTTFLAVDGPHLASVDGEVVKLKMIDVVGFESNSHDFFLNTGSPHYVEFVNNIEKYDVFSNGEKVRNDSRFSPGGTNANFVEQIGDNAIYVRTFERGVEDETYSCGTGVTAAALVSSTKGIQSPVAVKTLGGDLSVQFERKELGFINIYLNGPAVKVFEGTIDV